MKKFFTQNAFTLIELIVATLLIAVVIFGIFSIQLILSNNGQDLGQKYLVKSQTQTALNHILNNASLAYSDTVGDPAIVTAGIAGDAPGVTQSFCIHQPANKNGVVYNLANSATDIWLCYSWTNTNLNPYQINWCAEPFGAAGTPASCNAAIANGNIISVNGNNVTFLGSAFSIAPTYISSAANGGPLFSITIQDCLNNASGCRASGTSTDMNNNPEVPLSGSVIPLQASAS